ncbi:hypothetical protein BTA74_25835 [Salmonella enterica]|nr:hypothetical protein [Salmonella enterica subsp. enterica serovar Give]EAS2125217.1 hypothetical protein [Salmonella enterica]EBA6016894.1 hypothetical protein [Salmonella enterica]ECS7761276.1 hypothetical protein [Salmonella enterica subsp. enterica serovar Poona]
MTLGEHSQATGCAYPTKQQKELCRMHESGQYSISDLAELFSVSRPTVYRTLLRGKND